MSYDPDRELTQPQLDYTAGRNPKQQEFFLRCRRAREYVIKHPGCLSKELRQGARVTNREIDWLVAKNFIHYDSVMNSGGLMVTPL